jgi:xanthine dehydrogenase accessory factor
MIEQLFQTNFDSSQSLLKRLALESAVLVTVVATEGSVPRETDSWMAVFADVLVGSIGGGHLEHQAMEQALRLLQSGLRTPQNLRMALGPSLGQCCGGVVHLYLEPVSVADLPEIELRLQQAQSLTPVALFGGGHVGHALARLLCGLPFALRWIDSREGIFPQLLPSHVRCEHSEPVQSAVRDLAPQSRVLIMSFSHAQDYDVLMACLQRQRTQADLPYIGLIGSATKWATFKHRLEARGFTQQELAHVTCPIGVAGISSKLPEVIAVAVAAQLLQTLG